MTKGRVTRIRLPADVHARVKAEAAFHNIHLDTALGMCVAFLCTLTVPLSWRTDVANTHRDIADWLASEIQIQERSKQND